MTSRIPAGQKRAKARSSPARDAEHSAGSTRALRIFVYGTLLAGEAHHVLLAPARFLGAATTTPDFDLVACGDYPGLARAHRLGRMVRAPL
jgi:gamma-glutamylcyclotransferase (GGCT)/AIG2-like uncharacterized protein YtfP